MSSKRTADVGGDDFCVLVNHPHVVLPQLFVNPDEGLPVEVAQPHRYR